MESDQVDRLLRDFYQRELPKPWPRLRQPVNDKQLKSQSGHGLRRTYWSLAASLGLLAVGLGLAAQMLRGTPTERGYLPGNALPGEAKKPGDMLRSKPPATTPDKPPQPPPEDERRPFSSVLTPKGL